MSKISKPWKHQQETIKFFSKIARRFDASDPGTGKTRAAIEVWKRQRDAGGGCALILAPKSLLESAWAEEFNKFAPGIKYSVAYASNRERAFDVDADVYITNLDAVKWLAQQNKKFFKKFDTVIIDESTAFKHRTSQRSKAAKKVVSHFNYRQLLTGTPNSNSITDIWHQALLLDDGARLGNNFFGFRDSVCTPQQNGPAVNHIKWIDKEGSEQAVAYLLKDITIRHAFEDVMDVPPNYTRTVHYKMSAKLRKIYTELLDTSIAILETDTVSAVNAAVLRNKLLQCCSGAIYTNDSKYAVIDKGRYTLINDLVEEHQHSITFFNWRHQRDLLVLDADKRGIRYAVIDGSVTISERNKIVKQYQAGHLQTIYLHPNTGAHGLTLTRGTRTIFSSPIYQADFLKQAKHRIYRGGQTKKTETLLIEATSTVEQAVYERLNENTACMVNLLDVLRERG